MAKIEKIKKGTATIYPATIPQAVVDPTSGKSAREELDEKANHGYDAEETPKTLKQVETEKAEHGYAAEETPKTLKQVDDEVSQLAGEVSLLDAVQSAKIKDIENVLSTANLNQSAQLSVSGVSPLSLSKNAANGGMNVKLEGLTAENLVVNGDFRDGLTGWSPYFNRSIISVSNNIITVKLQTNTSLDQGLIDMTLNSPLTMGDVYYLSLTLEEEKTVRWYFHGDYKNMTKVGTSNRRSHIATPISWATTAIALDSTNIDDEYHFSNFKVINLTETFGAGNEPTKEQCDIIFSDYFEGVKSFEPTGRVRSVGKNLFEGIWEKGSIGGTGLNASGQEGTAIRIPLPIKVEPSTTYILINSASADQRIFYYDNNGDFIYYVSTVVNTFTTPSNCRFVRFRLLTTDQSVNTMLAKSNAVIPYEPYKETNLYLTAPELRSNGAVIDEIRKGANGYELVKRVGVGTLGNNLVTNGTFDTATGWTVVGESTVSNGSARIYTSDGSNSYIGDPSIMLSSTKIYKVIFDVLDSNGEELHLSSTAIPKSITIPTPIGTGISKLFVGNDGYLQFKRTMVRLTDVTIDNVKLHEVLPQDGTISNTSTFTELSDGTILYTLATPEIIPISYGGVLNSAENGTVYHEPVIADAGVYGANLPILLTDYPIASIEEIIKHENGVDTYLNVASAVIASDGLSFTHPNLTDGDLVLFTYAYDKESTNGNITATFYDSNVVKIDTVTGKAYKIEDVVTNGVLTRTLTEV